MTFLMLVVRSKSFRYGAWLCLLCALSLAGCSGEVLGPVTGLVTCDGVPVPGAVVIFRNDKLGVHMLAPANDSGVYEVEMAKGHGLPLGEYDVYVSPPIQDHPLGPISAPPSNVDNYPSIPKKYRERTTSGLKLKVEAAKNKLDIEMHSK